MANENTNNNSDVLIGYSARSIFDDCYEYNENACYVADTPETLQNFLVNAMLPAEDYQICPVRLSDVHIRLWLFIR